MVVKLQLILVNVWYGAIGESRAAVQPKSRNAALKSVNI